MGGLTKGLANIIPILLSTAGSRCNITDTKQRDLLTNISTNQILTNRVYNGNRQIWREKESVREEKWERRKEKKSEREERAKEKKRRKRGKKEGGRGERGRGSHDRQKKEFNDGDMHIAAPFENNEHFRRNSALFMPVVLKLAACWAICLR